jgi:hypothetical protein
MTPWPAWASTWYGMLLRFVVALWGIAAGGFIVLAGYYTAVDWKTGESDWTLGAGLAVIGGILFAIYCIYAAFRPTKITLIPALVLLGGSIALGLASAVGELVRG